MERIVVGKAVPQPAITAINRLLHGQAGYAELRRVAQSAATPRFFSPLPTPRRRTATGTRLGRHPVSNPTPRGAIRDHRPCSPARLDKRLILV
jgi:hypothetical protein